VSKTKSPTEYLKESRALHEATLLEHCRIGNWRAHEVEIVEVAADPHNILAGKYGKKGIETK
jgi:hypothetical protein